MFKPRNLAGMHFASKTPRLLKADLVGVLRLRVFDVELM